MPQATTLPPGQAPNSDEHNYKLDDKLDGFILEKLVLWHFSASLVFVLFVMLTGMLYALQLLQLYPAAEIEIFSPGRWRFIHTHCAIYGFIANAFLGALHWAVPCLTKHRVFSVKLSWFIFFAWQVVVLASVVGFLRGDAQAVEWGETPVWVDPFMLLGFMLIAVNFLTPIFKTEGPIHVSSWLFGSAFIWTVLLYAMGYVIPKYVVGGAASGAIIESYTHNLVGLFVTPIGWGLMYFFLPVVAGEPLWSHRLALSSFWVYAFLYPISNLQHFPHSSFHRIFQTSALIATIAVELIIASVILNFFLTIRQREKTLRSNTAIRWFYLGLIFYSLYLLQSALQLSPYIVTITQFTDWNVGQSHLIMFGVFGFWIFGFMVYLLPRLLGATDWYKPSWNSWHLWLTGFGLLVMFFDLVIAGLMQGTMWRDLAPWETVLTASQPYWLVRLLSGIVIILGQLFFFINIAMTWVHKGPDQGPDQSVPRRAERMDQSIPRP